jgi:hypothetical protein
VLVLLMLLPGGQRLVVGCELWVHCWWHLQSLPRRLLGRLESGLLDAVLLLVQGMRGRCQLLVGWEKLAGS